jgi:hypothetical protein
MTTLRRLLPGPTLSLTAACSTGGEKPDHTGPTPTRSPRATADPTPTESPRISPSTSAPTPSPEASAPPSRRFLLGSRTPETV